MFDKTWFGERFDVIEKEETQACFSLWGNSCVLLTKEDLKALSEGKVLHHYDGEYGTFVMLEEEENGTK